jgi:hypothetical protein
MDNIKMNFRETGLGGMNWIDVAQYSGVEGSCEYGNEPLGFIKCWEVLVATREHCPSVVA